MSTPEQRLGATATAVRRALAARTSQPDLIEDITQETLLRVVSAEQRLEPDALRAFAVVTARHLLIDHARAQGRFGRHQHRLVDYSSLTGPEEATLQREETDALAASLEGLDAQDRALLVAHEADGISVKDLALREGTSKGALAVRLARIRAQVRLEFLLAFRRTDLPSDRCRSVLMAISAGDARRQSRLGAADHVASCPTCSSLSAPLRQRRRAIAVVVWLTAAAAALRRFLGGASRSRPVQIAAAGGIVVVGAIGMARWLEDRAGTDSSAMTTTAATSAPPSSAPAPPTTLPPAVVVPPSPPPTSPPANGPLAIDGSPIPSGTDLRLYPGRIVTGAGLPITSVPAPRGFWVTPEEGVALWVQLIDAAGRSPGTFRVGDVVDLTGTIRALDGSPTAFGLSGDDAAHLENTGVYVEAAHDDLLNHRGTG